MELYIHYPFCVKKCSYCDFLSAPADEAQRAGYVQALLGEITAMSAFVRRDTVETIFIGGGTPSLMTPGELTMLMDTLRRRFIVSPDCEITLEANPGTLHMDFLRAMTDAGINRLSLGLQSASDRELACLGRIHKYADFCKSFDMARAAGIRNINVDLMSALPGQTLSSWERTLKAVAAFEPEHISAYSLIIEEGTPFAKLYGDEKEENASMAPPLPDEDTERQMYVRTEALLARYGYERYEISNYARPGFECRHNIGYWRRVPYLGLGLGASSLIDNRRFDNTRDMKKYIVAFGEKGIKGSVSEAEADRCHEHIQLISREDAMAEFMFLGLRLTSGVNDRDFRKDFGVSFMEVYGEPIDRHCREGLLNYIEATGQLALTAHGIDLSNYVLCDFL